MKRKLLAGTVLLVVLAGFTATDKSINEHQRALHALNRLSFGPRPGDVDRVMKDGIDVWIEQQLHPEGMPDRDVEARVAAYATLKMSDAEILRTFYQPILEARKARKANGEEGDNEKMLADLRRQTPPEKRPQRGKQDLRDQRLVRAVYSERYLNGEMVDFWFDDFTCYSFK